MEKISSFKSIFKLALLWSPSKRGSRKGSFLHSLTWHGKLCTDTSLKKAQAIPSHPKLLLSPSCHGPSLSTEGCEVRPCRLSNTRGINPDCRFASLGRNASTGKLAGDRGQLQLPGEAPHKAGAAPVPGGAPEGSGDASEGAEHSPVWPGIPPSALQPLPPSWPAGNRAEPPPRIARAPAACPCARDLLNKAHFSLLPSSNVTHSPSPGFFPPYLPSEILVKQRAGSGVLPALGEVKQRDV